MKGTSHQIRWLVFFSIKFMEKRRIYIIEETEIGETIWEIQKR